MDWSDLIKLFFVGGFPWISELKKLDIHFKLADYELSSVFNFFASLFAMGLFVYSYFVNAYQLLSLPQWWWFLLIAAILTILYFSIFLFYRKKVGEGKNKGLIVLNFVIYVGIFCSLTTGFGLLKAYKDHVIVNGQVMDNNKNIVSKAYFEIGFKNDNELNFYADKNGKFMVMLKKDELKEVQRITVKDESGRSFTANVFGEAMVFTTLKNIELK